MARASRAGLASLRSARPRRRIDDVRREELLSQIQDLVLAEGSARLTVDDLAARLQCSKSTLYAISSSKEYLVTTAIRHFFRDATAHIEERVADRGPGGADRCVPGRGRHRDAPPVSGLL